MNEEQSKSLARWIGATLGPFLIAHGYASESSLPLYLGVFASLIPLIWSMFVHTQTNAIAVVDQIAKQPNSPVLAIMTQNTPEGRALAKEIPGDTTIVASETAKATIKRIREEQ